MVEINELAKIISKYHIGCNLPIECYSDCAKCCAKAIQEAGYVKLPPDAAVLTGTHHSKDIMSEE